MNKTRIFSYILIVLAIIVPLLNTHSLADYDESIITKNYPHTGAQIKRFIEIKVIK